MGLWETGKTEEDICPTMDITRLVKVRSAMDYGGHNGDRRTDRQRGTAGCFSTTATAAAAARTNCRVGGALKTEPTD